MTVNFVCVVVVVLASGAHAIPHADPSLNTMASLEQDAKLQDLELRIQALSAKNDAEKNDDDDTEKLVAEAEKNDDDKVTTQEDGVIGAQDVRDDHVEEERVGKIPEAWLTQCKKVEDVIWSELRAASAWLAQPLTAADVVSCKYCKLACHGTKHYRDNNREACSLYQNNCLQKWVAPDFEACPEECGQAATTITREVTCMNPNGTPGKDAACDGFIKMYKHTDFNFMPAKPGTSKTCEATEPCPTAMDNKAFRAALKELRPARNDPLKTAAIAKWDVSEVTDFSSAFHASSYNPEGRVLSEADKRAQMWNLDQVDFSKWDVSKGTTFKKMFEWNYLFKGDGLSKWDVSKGIDFSRMFMNAEHFNSDVSQWNVGNGQNFEQMFFGANKFNSDVSKWNVGNGQNFKRMFLSADKFNSDGKSLSKWDLSKCKRWKCSDIFWASAYKGKFPIGAS